MLSGYYTIASGILTRQREIDTIGNNLVNAETPGYRAKRMVISAFEQELMTRKDASSLTAIGGAGHTATIVDEVLTDYESGMLTITDRVFDVAISGNGFFTVEGANGALYLTRNGQFDMDAEGYLVLPSVGRVQGENGPIRVYNSNFEIDETGRVTGANGNYLGTLRVSLLPGEAVPVELENGVYAAPAGVQPIIAGDYSIIHKSLELSNVDYNRELTLLLESQRAFQACSSALNIIESVNKKAHEIAKV